MKQNLLAKCWPSCPSSLACAVGGFGADIPRYSQISNRSHNPGGGTVLPLQSVGSTAGMEDAGLVFARLIIIRLCAF